MGYLIRVTDISLVRSVNGYFINFLFQCEEKLQKKRKPQKTQASMWWEVRMSEPTCDPLNECIVRVIASEQLVI